MLIHFSGKIFEGEFKDDHKSEGVEIDQDFLYIGSFRLGLFSGNGFLRRDADIRCGVFRNGEWANHGVILNDETVIFQNKF